jgi:hypothetical protein
MQLYRNTQDSDVFVPQRSVTEIKLEDLVFSEPEPKHNTRFKNDITLTVIGLFSFGLIIGILAFI